MSAAVPPDVSESDRAARLDAEIERYIRRGYRVVARTPTTAQLLRPKVFSRFWSLCWFLLLGVGLIVYLCWYLSKRDSVLYLTVDARGHLVARQVG